MHHVVADITGATGLRIIRAILAGERDPEALACLRHYGCHASAETIAKALTGNYRSEHLFALEQALALYDAYHEKVSACDVRIEAVLKELSIHRGRDHGAVPPPRRRQRTDQANALAFDVRAALFALLGKDITAIDGLGAYLSLKLVAECGDDLSSWPSAKHFTSWLGLAPSNKISGGKMLSSRTRRSGGRAAALLRLAAVTVGRTDTALGAFYRRLSSRIGKAKAVTATARKIAVAVLQRRASSEWNTSIPEPRRTRHATARGWSTICTGVPRHSALFSSPWSRKLVLPFLRNRSPASARRSWRAATSRRSAGAAAPLLPPAPNTSAAPS